MQIDCMRSNFSFSLNIIPGLGTGYIYQRRWRAYWITLTITFFWILLSLLIQTGIDPSDPASTQTDLTGFLGILVISSITACEAALRTKKEKQLLDKEIQKLGIAEWISENP